MSLINKTHIRVGIDTILLYTPFINIESETEHIAHAFIYFHYT